MEHNLRESAGKSMTIFADPLNAKITDQYGVDVQAPDIINKDNKDVIQFYQDENSPKKVYEEYQEKTDNEISQDALADRSLGAPELDTINGNGPMNLNLFLPETKIKTKGSLSNLEFQKHKMVKNYYKMRDHNKIYPDGMVFKKPKSGKYKPSIMPGSGAISFTNYKMTTKSNPYLGVVPGHQSNDGSLLYAGLQSRRSHSKNLQATKMVGRRKRELENVIEDAKQIENHNN